MSGRIVSVRHLYRCPLRWADMDALGHVNNVRYVDYLQEARVDLLRLHGRSALGEELAEGIVVVQHDIEFTAPLSYRAEPVSIESWVTEIRAATFTLAYEIFDEVDGERHVYARATTILSPFVFSAGRPRRLEGKEKELLSRFLEPTPGNGAAASGAGTHAPPEDGTATAVEPHRYECNVRWSDVDAYGHVNNVMYFEYFQEARIMAMVDAVPLEERDAFVVARVVVDYRRPLLFRAEPYDIETRATRIGRSSFTLEAIILDDADRLAVARATVVAFDPETQRSRPLQPAEVDGLRRILTAS